MSRLQHEFDLDWEGRRCLVEDLGSQAARQVARRIANVVGGAVKESSTAVAMDVNAAGLVAMGTILERLDDATCEWLTQTFSKVTRIEKEPGTEDWLTPRDVQESAFGGGKGLARWLRWMSFCLEITCADFFRAAFAEFSRIQAKKDQALTGVTPPPNGSQSTYSRSGSFTAS